MDEYFFASDPWSGAFYHPAYSQYPAYSRHRPFMSPAASPSGLQRRAVASPAPPPSPSPSPVPTQKPRVVSIPVRYMEMEDRDSRRAAARALTPSEAATRIQRIFRGFFVRMMVERVSQIATEVDAIEEMMASEAKRDKIRSDPREKLRVGETLMALLLRLDSVLGVREYRRKVIRRVIRLQEMVDSIPAVTQTPEAPTQIADETVYKEKMEEAANDDALEEQQCLGKTAVAESADAPIPDAEEAPEEEILMQQEDHSGTIADEENDLDDQSEVSIEAARSQHETLNMMEACEEKHVVNDEFDDFVVVPMDEDFRPSPTAAESETVNENHIIQSVAAAERNTAPPEPTEAAIAPAMVEKNLPRSGDIKDTVEKVMAESQKLQRLVAALCERNTQQCELLAGLVSRVDRLEQTVQKMENKKKKKRLANSTLASPVGKKNNSNME